MTSPATTSGTSKSDMAPIEPTRVLVQTKTHLVPGTYYGDKVRGMRNRICQHVCHRDFIWGQDNMYALGVEFGYDNRTCFFMVDIGMTAEDGQTPTDDPRILWFRWTGDSL